jgi:hypothetical protein
MRRSLHTALLAEECRKRGTECAEEAKRQRDPELQYRLGDGGRPNTRGISPHFRSVLKLYHKAVIDVTYRFG